MLRTYFGPPSPNPNPPPATAPARPLPRSDVLRCLVGSAHTLALALPYGPSGQGDPLAAASPGQARSAPARSGGAAAAPVAAAQPGGSGGATASAGANAARDGGGGAAEAAAGELLAPLLAASCSPGLARLGLRYRDEEAVSHTGGTDTAGAQSMGSKDRG
jgi:hypothetical protein